MTRATRMWLRRAICVTTALALVGVLGTPAALAGKTRPSSTKTSTKTAGTAATATTPCTIGTATAVFAAWGDEAAYGLAPGGSLESGTPAWTLSGGAAPAKENEPWRVAGASDARSLSLPSGASATSPLLCLELGTPTWRFFLVNRGGPGTLKAEVIVHASDGSTWPVWVGSLGGSASWSLSPVLWLPKDYVALLFGGTSVNVALRLTADGGDWLVDDVYVDPFKLR